MNTLSNLNSQLFNINYNGIELKFELFTQDFILEELQNDPMIECKTIEIPNKRGRYKELNIYHNNCDCNYKYYFVYIKFFTYDEKEYGLVGGKTNYKYPDVDFSTEAITIGRSFLYNNKYNWSRKIIVINYKTKDTDITIEEKQALFLEKYIQRKFYLLDS